jgi:hypothetical protein
MGAFPGAGLMTLFTVSGMVLIALLALFWIASHRV